MEMLEYLKIKNYQIHKDLEVNFTPNLNVFVGASDRGKSAALRALLWVFTNRPLGEDFRTWDSKETKVEVGIDGRKIIRCKSDTNNYYQVDDKKLEAPGTEVPKEIIDLINISDVNIQRQGDSYFLISASSGEVGKYINQIIGLEVMDGSIKYASQKVKSIKSDLKVSKFDLKNTKSELAKYKWIDKADKDLQDLEKMQVRLNEETIKCDALTNLIDDYEKYSLEIDKFKKLPEAKKDINGLMALYSTYQSKMQLVNKLTNLIEEYNYAMKDKYDLVLLSDPHIRSDVPRCRNEEEFHLAMLAKLEFIKDLCNKHKCPLICTGDIGHHPAKSWSIWLIERVI